MISGQGHDSGVTRERHGLGRIRWGRQIVCSLHVPLKIAPLGRRVQAAFLITLERLLSCVNPLVPHQVGQLGEGGLAVGPVTVVGALPSVCLHVPLDIGQLCGAEVAARVGAAEALLAAMGPLMPNQVAGLRKGSSAPRLCTLVGLLSRVGLHVAVQVALLGSSKVAGWV